MAGDGYASERELQVRKAFADQANWCEKLGSPLTSALCVILAERLDRTTEIGRRILDWPGDKPDAMGDSVPLRIAGGLHALVRRGRLPGLAEFYPPNPLPDATVFAAAIAAALADAEADLMPWLDSAPQTNEVARSAQIYAGLLAIAAATAKPLALYELGASGGLNLYCDRFAYRFAGRDFGLPGSAVQLAPDWNGAAPAPAEVNVVSRRGCDLNPFDLAEASDRERLTAYVWADQGHRLDRLAAALAIARAEPTRIEAADAGKWLSAVAAAPPEPGICRVVFHTIARQYFPEATERAVAAAIERLGATATEEAPFAWLSFENE
ncbi:MAG: DUF2332 family protein, partial [Ancalomicrobiaceae bacterium]|nr:DUF2332 family protein [Ancalomicrobiaceae bacterium]